MNPQARYVPAGDSWYFAVWADSISSALEQLAGTSFRVERCEDPVQTLFAHGAGTVAFRFAVTGSLRGEHTLRLPLEMAVRLAQLLLTGVWERPAADQLSDEQRDACDELSRQFAGMAATGLKAKAGGEVQFQLRKEAGGRESALETGLRFRATGGDSGAEIEMSLGIDGELARSLAGSASSVQDTPARPAGRGTVPVGASESRTSETNLDLLMDIELNATLRFGERQLLLRDVLELGPGSVVELDRQVEEPAELLVGGKVVARGEVVIVDGNYGFRVGEVLSHSQRIDSLVAAS